MLYGNINPYLSLREKEDKKFELLHGLLLETDSMILIQFLHYNGFRKTEHQSMVFVISSTVKQYLENLSLKINMYTCFANNVFFRRQMVYCTGKNIWGFLAGRTYFPAYIWT